MDKERVRLTVNIVVLASVATTLLGRLLFFRLSIDAAIAQTILAGVLLMFIANQTHIMAGQRRISDTQTQIMERQNEITEDQSEINDYIGDFEYARFLLVDRLPKYQEKKKELELEMDAKKKMQSGRLHPWDYRDLTGVVREIALIQADLAELSYRAQQHFILSRNRFLSRVDEQRREIAKETINNLVHEAFSEHRKLIEAQRKVAEEYDRASRRTSSDDVEV